MTETISTEHIHGFWNIVNFNGPLDEYNSRIAYVITRNRLMSKSKYKSVQSIPQS